ncbi:MAG: HD-GYP domain-containing protein [Bacillota bacterium]
MFYSNKGYYDINILQNIYMSMQDDIKQEIIGHSRRVSMLIKIWTASLRLEQEKVAKLELLALYHDIGKFAVPQEILQKKENLTYEEWSMLKNHPVTGYSIAKGTKHLKCIALDILHHHERWDGDGYPHQLKGETIPYNSRMLAIADAYDVMFTGKTYKKSTSHMEALKEIERCAGSQFDPVLAEKFITFFNECKKSDYIP